MTVIAVMADPPEPGLVLPELAATSPLSEAATADLYRAMLGDVLRAVERSGGDLLVNYRPAERLPDGVDVDSEAAVRSVVADALGGTADVRFEPQVGSTFAARAGNTVTHLLREEGARSAAVVRGSAPFLSRSAVDSAAMKLRSTPVVLGPSTDGRVYYAAFTEPVDFADAFAPPAVETLTGRARDADLDVDYLPMAPVVERGADLRTVLPFVRARRRAGRRVPERTAEFLSSRPLSVEFDGEVPDVTGVEGER